MNRRILAIFILGLLLTALLCSLSLANNRSYRVEPRISLPEYRSDAARAIDAYERMMQRYMDITERDLNFIALQMREMVRQMNQLDNKMENISSRLERIEREMGIGESQEKTSENQSE